MMGHSVVNVAGDVVKVAGTATDLTEQLQASAAWQKGFDSMNASAEERMRNENLALR